jgi:hypothetical protein
VADGPRRVADPAEKMRAQRLVCSGDGRCVPAAALALAGYVTMVEGAVRVNPNRNPSYTVRQRQCGSDGPCVDTAGQLGRAIASVAGQARRAQLGQAGPGGRGTDRLGRTTAT